MSDHRGEIEKGKRFRFGENWSRYVESIDDDRIHEAERSLQQMLDLPRMDGMSFLDVGSGSGLFSLAAHRLGARVHSFDFDPQSVATTKKLCAQYSQGGPIWHIEEGSALDREYLQALGQFDIVYAWGVLHHTGDMWQAMENVTSCVSANGRLFLALYNDQELISAFWLKVKRLYCSGLVGHILVIPIFFSAFSAFGLLGDLLRRRNPLRRYIDYRQKRGMSLMHDWIDWLGGLPYETAKPGDVCEYYLRRGFSLMRLVTRHSLGCNEFVFVRASPCAESHVQSHPT